MDHPDQAMQIVANWIAEHYDYSDPDDPLQVIAADPDDLKRCLKKAGHTLPEPTTKEN